MVKLDRSELNMLKVLCEDRSKDLLDALKNPKTTAFEMALANMQMEYMLSLMKKLDGIISSDAKRIEVR